MDIGDYIIVGYRNQNSIFLSVKKLIQKNKNWKYFRQKYKYVWKIWTNKKTWCIIIIGVFLDFYIQFSTYLQMKVDNMAKLPL